MKVLILPGQKTAQCLKTNEVYNINAVNGIEIHKPNDPNITYPVSSKFYKVCCASGLESDAKLNADSTITLL